MFVCFALKCERTNAFKIRLPNWFSLCLHSDRKILPLCYKHVIAMSSRKIALIHDVSHLCRRSGVVGKILGSRGHSGGKQLKFAVDVM